MTNNQVNNILIIFLFISVIALFILIGIFCFLYIKEKIRKNKKEENKSVINPTTNKTKEVTFKSYTRESIYKFMEFDKIDDNMIIQKNGKRYLMVVECQGINYDLMSQVEKTSVEEGFLQFLNSLRHPIQIYIQTRTVNLSSSITEYNKRVEEANIKLDKMLMEYEQIIQNPISNKEIIKKYNYEIAKQKNLCEYGKDIIENTKRMNLNKNVLNKKYYVIIPYYSEEANNENLGTDEIKNLAFSELYTRAQSIIRTLFVCNVNAKILNSTELVELLYVAYNRDESETFEIEKAIMAGCEDMYSTAPDVLDKRIKALDKEIADKAEQRAVKAVEEVKSVKKKVLEKKEENYEDLIDEMAKIILDQNEKYIGKEVAKESKKKIEEAAQKRNIEKGGKLKNEKK